MHREDGSIMPRPKQIVVRAKYVWGTETQPIRDGLFSKCPACGKFSKGPQSVVKITMNDDKLTRYYVCSNCFCDFRNGKHLVLFKTPQLPGWFNNG